MGEEHKVYSPYADDLSKTPVSEIRHTFTLVLQREEGNAGEFDGYSTTVLDYNDAPLPGCYSQGTNEDRAIANTLEAMSNWWRSATKCRDDR